MKWRDQLNFVLTLGGVIAVMVLWSIWLHFPEELPAFASNAIAVFFGVPLYLAIVTFTLLAVVILAWIFWRGLTASDETRIENKRQGMPHNGE